jgi:predicted transcriptional regulator
MQGKAAMAKIPLNVRVDPSLLQRLKDVARAENRTVSNLVDTALRRYVENSRNYAKPSDSSEQK